MVSSAVLMFTWRISSARSSRADIILMAWPRIGSDTVFRSTCGLENLTSTSAIMDFELAKSSLILSLMEEEAEEVGELAMVGERYPGCNLGL